MDSMPALLHALFSKSLTQAVEGEVGLSTRDFPVYHRCRHAGEADVSTKLQA